MFPAGAGIPSGMGFERGGWQGLLRSGGRGRRNEVAERRDVRRLQADQRVGAHNQLPPPLDGRVLDGRVLDGRVLDGRVLGDAVVRPAQIILRMLKAVLNGLISV
jgi:hypothetical protein